MRSVGSAALVVALLWAASVQGFVPQEPGNDYWERRARIFLSEDERRIGGDLQLRLKELLANGTLMAAKFKELDDSFRVPSNFLPARNFMLVSRNISDSPVFKIIEKMPKGAVLHGHDTTITSFEYVLKNITYRPNLYVCEVEGLLKFKFFEKPNGDCQWQLLSEVRKKNATIDDRITRQMTMLTEDPDQAYPNNKVAWVQFGLIFATITPMLTYRPVYEDHFYQGLLELYNDNVFYMELRTLLPTLYDLDGKEYGPLDVARIYKKVTDRFIKDHPDFLGVKLILSSYRDSTDSEMKKQLELARLLVKSLPGFVVGFDIAHNEDKGRPLVDFADSLRSVSNDVQFFFHAAETVWNGQESDENLIDAVLLGTKRIGHGFGLTKHPEILELARQKGIALELQPISNQVLALINDLRSHPVHVLFANNYPVVVSYDNPAVWGVKGLSYDFYEAFMGIMSRHADLRALKKLAINSIQYSSMSNEEKIRAMDVWTRKWDEFIQTLTADSDGNQSCSARPAAA